MGIPYSLDQTPLSISHHSQIVAVPPDVLNKIGNSRCSQIQAAANISVAHTHMNKPCDRWQYQRAQYPLKWQACTAVSLRIDSLASAATPPSFEAVDFFIFRPEFNKHRSQIVATLE